MPIPDQIIQEIKYRNDIEQIISPYVNLKRRGKNLVGLCPFHNEKTPSFTVYPESGSFYCFGCGVGGDIFSFVSLAENLDYVESIKLLAERSGVALPQDGYDDSMQRLKNTVYEINRETARFYHEYLMSPEGKWALDYLTGRGLTLATIRHFGLGAAPDGWNSLTDHLHQKGFSDADMMQANVIAKGNRGGYYDRFRRRVMFPIINIRGKVIGFSGRKMPNDDSPTGKYVNTSDTPVYKKSENLFAMNFAKTHCEERIILVEGNMDVISLHQAGFENAVAALGTSFTPEQAKLLTRYTKEIVLMLDADAAGQKAMRRAGEILKDTGLNVRVVVIPDGKDPDEFIRKNGAARFGALLEGSVSEIEYKLLHAADGIETESDDGKLKYLSAAAEILAESNDDLERDLYIGRLCGEFGVSRTALETKIRQIRAEQYKRRQKKEIAQIISPHYTKDDVNPERRNSIKGTEAEETLIAILFQHPDLIASASQALLPEQMITGLNRRIYSILLQCYNEGRELDISYFGQHLNPKQIGYLVSLQHSEKGAKNAPIVLKDCIRVILEEGTALSSSRTGELSTEEWAENMKQMIENKKRGMY
ncbi:MAG: DNA primase [Clostridia bacterium]|nr:DNA primase [Clostridia bacterium]